MALSLPRSTGNNTEVNVNTEQIHKTVMLNRHKTGKRKQRSGRCNGPRVQYTFLENDDLRVSPVSPLSMKKRIVKTVVGENPGSRKTGHYKTKRRGKSLYMVSLPQHYRMSNYVHYSKRKPGSLQKMKEKMVRQNTFFSPKSQLRPGSAPLNRHHPSLHLRKRNSYSVLIDEYLKSPANSNYGSDFEGSGDEVVRVVDDDEDITYNNSNGESRNIIQSTPAKTRRRPQTAHSSSRRLIKNPPSSPVMHSERYGFNYTPDSPLHRAMSHSERHSLRPQTATLVRRKSKIDLIESRRNSSRIRPKSAAASTTITNTISVRQNGKTTKVLTIDTDVNDFYTNNYSGQNNHKKNHTKNQMQSYLRHKYKDSQRWKAEFNPHILQKHDAIPTSRGYRKITKILKVKPNKQKSTKRRMIKSRSSGYIKKPLVRPQSAGAQPGGTYPISTRYPPHYPVKINMYEQLKQPGFPVKD